MTAAAHLVESFLDMMSAERGAAANTLAAYARDLTDFCGWLASRMGGSGKGMRWSQSESHT